MVPEERFLAVVDVDADVREGGVIDELVRGEVDFVVAGLERNGSVKAAVVLRARGVVDGHLPDGLPRVGVDDPAVGKHVVALVVPAVVPAASESLHVERRRLRDMDPGRFEFDVAEIFQ